MGAIADERESVVDPADRRYWAFLSYSGVDRRWARRLQRALEGYRVPARLARLATEAGPAPRRLRPIFRDRTELPAHHDLEERIRQALDRSRFLIVICSPDAAASWWVNAEIGYFRATHGPERILAVIVAGSPSGAHEDCFPPALRYHADEGGQAKRGEPIAADLRPGGDGPRLARLKLIAGMLGVGLDDLVRRDDRRRQRWMAGVAAGSLAGMALTGALAAAALIARDEAQRRRAQAEDLITFMLGDLPKRLEPSGRLDVMDIVARKALAYYEAQSPADLDDASLGRRSRALRLTGQIDLRRGTLGDASRAFTEAAATTAEVLARKRNDGARLFDHAQSLYWLGELARQRGQMDKASAALEDYRRLAERLSALDPRNDDWRAEVEDADVDLGVVLLEQGRLAEALADFQAGLPVAEALARRHPDAGHRFLVAQSLAYIADVLARQGRPAEARARRRAEAEIYRSLLAADPSLEQEAFSLIIALEEIAKIDAETGEPAAALAGFAAATRRAEALLATRPDDMDQAAVTAHAHSLLGEALRQGGRAREARSAQRRASALLTLALAHDDSVVLWRLYRVEAELLGSALEAQAGRPAAALALDRQAMAGLAPGAVGTAASAPLLDRVRLRMGEDLAALGQAQAARAQWAAIADAPRGAIDRYDPGRLATLEAADTRLGRAEAAGAIARRRRAMARPAA